MADAAGGGAQHIGWYATDDHPRRAEGRIEGGAEAGVGGIAVFEVLGSMVYPASGHPTGPSAHPWYQVRDGLVYRVDGHPEGPSGEAAFLVHGEHVFPAGTDPLAFDAAPWFLVGPPPTRAGC
jgi:hypothetical protein